MKKILCALLFVMLCISTTYAAEKDTMNTYNDGEYLYTPIKGKEPSKFIISKKNNKTAIIINSQAGKTLYRYTFAENSKVFVKKVNLRPEMEDLLCYMFAENGQYIQELIIIGKTANGMGKVYDIGEKGIDIGSKVKIWVERDCIHLQGIEIYEEDDEKKARKNPEYVIAPAMQSGKGYTYKMYKVKDFYKYKIAKKKSSKPVL